MSFAASLRLSCADGWQAAVGHPMVRATADGTLPRPAFNAWIEQDHHFVSGLRGFVDALTACAPPDDAPGLASGRAALDPELDLFRAYAEREGIDLSAPVSDVCRRYLAFLHGTIADGYATALSAYYGCERAYLEAWSAVRESNGLDGPYATWVENWTSDGFRAYVDWLGSRIDVAVGERDRARCAEAFCTAVDLEVQFWDDCFRRTH